ncbi:ASPIC/UnbV domain-containing protein, partial [bacterium]|nr:ASPIC/UnbV domain-containing protein [bacterium]
HAFAHNHQRMHFGLGPYLRADRLTVHWPSGIVQTLENVRADQVIRIVESP